QIPSRAEEYSGYLQFCILLYLLMFFVALPVTFKQEVENLEVKEGDSGVFCCELSKPGAAVDWRKGRVILKPGYKYEMKQVGCLTKLTINNIEESDAGKYTCKTQDSQSTADEQKAMVSLLTAPPITFKTKLRNQQVEEENNLTLSCELSKPGLAVEWRKGEELLKNNFKYHIKDRNSIMDLTIKNTQLEDSGLYSCNYGDVKTTMDISTNSTLRSSNLKTVAATHVKQEVQKPLQMFQ
uniref:Ig-like domain-containing protein n=1 Tax=Monopterus albus TaxID=43700 RepID=A0A3Q3JU58_MONAL